MTIIKVTVFCIVVAICAVSPAGGSATATAKVTSKTPSRSKTPALSGSQSVAPRNNGVKRAASPLKTIPASTVTGPMSKSADGRVLPTRKLSSSNNSGTIRPPAIKGAVGHSSQKQTTQSTPLDAQTSANSPKSPTEKLEVAAPLTPPVIKPRRPRRNTNLPPTAGKERQPDELGSLMELMRQAVVLADHVERGERVNTFGFGYVKNKKLGEALVKFEDGLKKPNPSVVRPASRIRRPSFTSMFWPQTQPNAAQPTPTVDESWPKAVDYALVDHLLRWAEKKAESLMKPQSPDSQKLNDEQKASLRKIAELRSTRQKLEDSKPKLPAEWQRTLDDRAAQFIFEYIEKPNTE